MIITGLVHLVTPSRQEKNRYFPYDSSNSNTIDLFFLKKKHGFLPVIFFLCAATQKQNIADTDNKIASLHKQLWKLHNLSE